MSGCPIRFRFFARIFAVLSSLIFRGYVDFASADSPLDGTTDRLSSSVSVSIEGKPEVGYDLLTNKAYLPPDFDQEDFDNIWRVWPRALRKMAEEGDTDLRRRMAFERYGLTERTLWNSDQPDGSKKPLQYVVSELGQWSMNCFSCHGGTVSGKTHPGAPNNRFAFELLSKEIRASKLKLGKPLSKFDLGSLIMPLGKTRGTTNAVMFGVGLMHYRDEELDLVRGIAPPEFIHHDMDAPPWWYFNKRPQLYIDGFAEKGHRGLLQFMMVEENDSATLKGWSDDFRHVFAFLSSLRSPSYTGPIDVDLANRGRRVFRDQCTECHGTYQTKLFPSDVSEYPNRRVPLEELGTDPVRLTALPSEGRAKYGRSWFGDYGRQKTVIEPDGYIAPPLDGIWASAPYFHNGSVPTLWQVLNPASRPKYWRHVVDLDGRIDDNFNDKEVGIEYEIVLKPPTFFHANPQELFNTEAFGKSNQGHDFPDILTMEEKACLLEYLKCL